MYIVMQERRTHAPSCKAVTDSHAPMLFVLAPKDCERANDKSEQSAAHKHSSSKQASCVVHPFWSVTWLLPQWLVPQRARRVTRHQILSEKNQFWVERGASCLEALSLLLVAVVITSWCARVLEDRFDLVHLQWALAEVRQHAGVL